MLGPFIATVTICTVGLMLGILLGCGKQFFKATFQFFADEIREDIRRAKSFRSMNTFKRSIPIKELDL